MKFTEEEKLFLIDIATKEKQTMTDDSTEVKQLQVVLEKLAEGKMLFGNYLHRLFVVLKKAISEEQLPLQTEQMAAELAKKILRRINANK